MRAPKKDTVIIGLAFEIGFRLPVEALDPLLIYQTIKIPIQVDLMTAAVLEWMCAACRKEGFEFDPVSAGRGLYASSESWNEKIGVIVFLGVVGGDERIREYKGDFSFLRPRFDSAAGVHLPSTDNLKALELLQASVDRSLREIGAFDLRFEAIT